jgi:hypothetical protein
MKPKVMLVVLAGICLGFIAGKWARRSTADLPATAQIRATESGAGRGGAAEPEAKADSEEIATRVALVDLRNPVTALEDFESFLTTFDRKGVERFLRSLFKDTRYDRRTRLVLPSLCRAYAEGDPEKAFDLAGQCDNPALVDALIGEAYGSLARTDPLLACERLSGIADHARRLAGLRVVVAVLKDSDPRRALALIDRELWDDQKGLIDAVYESWVKADPVGAAAFAKGRWSDARSYGLHLMALGKAWADVDFDAALRWSESLHSGPSKDGVVSMVLQTLGRRDPSGALSLFDSIARRTVVNLGEAQNGIIHEWVKSDLDAALAWAVENKNRSYGGDPLAQATWRGIQVDVKKVADFLEDHFAGAEGVPERIFPAWEEVFEQLGRIDLRDALARADRMNSSFMAQEAMYMVRPSEAHIAADYLEDNPKLQIDPEFSSIALERLAESDPSRAQRLLRKELGDSVYHQRLRDAEPEQAAELAAHGGIPAPAKSPSVSVPAQLEEARLWLAERAPDLGEVSFAEKEQFVANFQDRHPEFAFEAAVALDLEFRSGSVMNTAWARFRLMYPLNLKLKG